MPTRCNWPWTPATRRACRWKDGYSAGWASARPTQRLCATQKIVQPLPEQSKNWDSTGNLLIKGDNLDALRLLRHNYFGKVKLIYIDPPYNTQSDAFIYRDDFTTKQTEVLAQLGYAKDNIDYIKNIYGARTRTAAGCRLCTPACCWPRICCATMGSFLSRLMITSRRS